MTIPGHDQQYLSILKKSVPPGENNVVAKIDPNKGGSFKKGKYTEPDDDDNVEIRVDKSDESNITYKEDYQGISVSRPNKPGDGTPPDDGDETYLSLLKKSIKPTKIKIDITKDNKTPDPSNKTH